MLQMKQVEKHHKYLGIPTVSGGSKKIMFKSILDRVWRKLRVWKEKLLSRADKEVLIKAVIQAIPIYLMGVYKFLVTIIRKISSGMARFWWVAKGNLDRGMHWLSWDKLCKPKWMRRMGFKDIVVFNDALLGQVWWLLYYKNSLLSRVMKAKYYPNTDVLNASLGYSNSYSWISISGAKSLVKEGIMHREGMGIVLIFG